MLYLRNHIQRQLLSSIHHTFKSQILYYSTTKTAFDDSSSAKRALFVDFLTRSLGFTKESAISSCSKVRRLRTTRNFDSVVGVLKKYGFDDAQIKDLVSWIPKILLYRANETLKPKLRVFLELGLSGSDLISLLKRNPSLFELGLQSRIIPTIDYLRSLLGSNEKVVETINRSRWLFSTSIALRMFTANIVMLRSYGFSDEQIGKFVNRNAMHFTQPPSWLTSKLNWIESKLGVTRDSTVFFRCFHAMCSNSIVLMEKKMEVYKSYGFSDQELTFLFKNQPYCFALSEDTIRDKLSFFMNELGYTPAYLASCPNLFSLSLEKRVKPRYEVVKILKAKMLLGRHSLITLVTYPELRFQDYLRRFEKEIPDLYETYVSSVRQISN
ncbi:transcription termination factor MTERF8, chloroplastic-like [Rutidosis leptorrhynchoides]|uniref:transcription termination factor MTERF8, chloroplastic-like n=1 Tax=Rutidosis leptorrhynchoides TaxID=125765 RepID=UPI003A9A4558